LEDLHLDDMGYNFDTYSSILGKATKIQRLNINVGKYRCAEFGAYLPTIDLSNLQMSLIGKCITHLTITWQAAMPRQHLALLFDSLGPVKEFTIDLSSYHTLQAVIDCLTKRYDLKDVIMTEGVSDFCKNLEHLILGPEMMYTHLTGSVAIAFPNLKKISGLYLDEMSNILPFEILGETGSNDELLQQRTLEVHHLPICTEMAIRDYFRFFESLQEENDDGDINFRPEVRTYPVDLDPYATRVEFRGNGSLVRFVIPPAN
jgi:hypothetical protein